MARTETQVPDGSKISMAQAHPSPQTSLEKHMILKQLKHSAVLAWRSSAVPMRAAVVIVAAMSELGSQFMVAPLVVELGSYRCGSLIQMA